jgi:hypothetical protein
MTAPHRSFADTIHFGPLVELTDENRAVNAGSRFC